MIPALNSEKTIGHTLSSLFSSNFPRSFFEVLVIDNGSTDNTLLVAEKYPTRIFHCPERGIGPPRNLGIKEAKGEIVCFTDSDCIVETDWLLKIQNFFETHPEAQGVGGPVIPYDKKTNKLQKLAGEIFLEDQGYPREMKRVCFESSNGLLYGANCAYQKCVLVSVGGFEEPGGSALELCLRLAVRRKQLFFNPDIRVFHTFPHSFRGLLRQQFRWGIDNAKLLRYKNFIAKEHLLRWYSLAKYSFSSRGSARNWTKKLLRFTQLTVFQLGRMYGYNVKSNVFLRRFAQ